MTVEAALRRELEGYEATGRKDRAAQVQEQIDLLGVPAEPPATVSVTDDPATAADDPAAVEAPVKAKRARKA